MTRAEKNLEIKVRHLLDAYDLVQEFAFSYDEVKTRSGLETLKFKLKTVFPDGGQSSEYPIARKLAEFTIWRIDQLLKNKIEISHVNHALVQDVRLITVLVETYKSESKSKGGNKPLTHHKDSSK